MHTLPIEPVLLILKGSAYFDKLDLVLLFLERRQSMQTARLFKHWDEVRAGLIEALEKLDHRQLDFVPGPGLWSLKETVCHIAET
jgi:hypothetical protein